MRNGLVEGSGDGEDRVGMIGGQKLLLILVVDLEVMLQELKEKREKIVACWHDL